MVPSRRQRPHSLRRYLHSIIDLEVFLQRARTSEVAVDEYWLNAATSEIRLNSDSSGRVLCKEHVGKGAGRFSAIHSESSSASTNGDARD